MNSRLEEKIVIFGIYTEFSNKVKEVLEQRNQNFEIIEVRLDNFLEKANECKKRGVECIIVRGALAEVLKEKTDMSIVKINISGYEILKLIYGCRGLDKTIGVMVERANEFSEIELISRVIGLSLYPVILKPNVADINKAIVDILEKGIDTMVGLSIGDKTVEYFKDNGVDYMVIESECMSINIALEEACNLCNMRFKERLKKERLQAILSFSSEGVISFDATGTINMINSSGSNILNIKTSKYIDKKISELFSDVEMDRILSKGKMALGVIIRRKNIQIVADIIPVIIDGENLGAVATFKKTKDIQKIEQKIRLETSQKGLTAKYTFDSIVGKSESIKLTIEKAKMYSKMPSTVLITGETGAGKEVFAQAIHNESNRKDNVFVAINCSALPLSLLESELFGYSSGAFTGARKNGKQGLFELAHNGTIFLDEIGDMEKTMQSRLLRVIQEREIMRIGDDKVIPVDVRIIAATNIDLYDDVQNGKFRLDLYFRLNVLDLHILPLRERKDDIAALVEELMLKLNNEYNSNVEELDNSIIEKLKEYEWPGNVRELQNVLEKIMVISREKVPKLNDVEHVLNKLPKKNKNNSYDELLELTLDEIEKKIIEEVLKHEGYNKTKASLRLGINRNTLSRKLSN